MYQVVFSSKAEKSFKHLPKEYQIKIKNKILEFETEPLINGTIKLTGFPYADYRHRVGDYRILFSLDKDKKIIYLFDIKRRTSTTY